MRAHNFFVFDQQQNLVRRVGASKKHIVGLASVCSKTVVLLLSIAMHYLVFFHFFYHLAKEGRAGCFTLIVILLLSGFGTWCLFLMV